ncbi:MAG: hypothetical protein R3F17_12395 [Planctomycetota bacterium]
MAILGLLASLWQAPVALRTLVDGGEVEWEFDPDAAQNPRREGRQFSSSEQRGPQALFNRLPGFQGPDLVRPSAAG